MSLATIFMGLLAARPVSARRLKSVECVAPGHGARCGRFARCARRSASGARLALFGLAQQVGHGPVQRSQELAQGASLRAGRGRADRWAPGAAAQAPGSARAPVPCTQNELTGAGRGRAGVVEGVGVEQHLHFALQAVQVRASFGFGIQARTSRPLHAIQATRWPAGKQGLLASQRVGWS